MPPEVEVAVERTARPAADTKATATAAAKLRNELTPLSLWDLLVRARDAGVAQSKLDTAMEGQAPKRAVLALVVDHSTAAEPAHPDDSCITAARKGDVAAVKQAIAAGAGFEATGAGEMTALMHAASAGQLEVLRVLVAEAAQRSESERTPPAHLLDAPMSEAADPARRGNVGWFVQATALVFAGRWGHTEAALELLRAGASVDGLPPPSATPHLTATPLHAASFHNHPAAVAVLLEHGADPARRFQNLTPREWAEKHGHEAVLAVFTASKSTLSSSQQQQPQRTVQVGGGQRPKIPTRFRPKLPKSPKRLAQADRQLAAAVVDAAIIRALLM
eukprot:COSAG05_NODE_2792_length_2631_cov_3.495261_2_plen_333_part_00